MTEPSARAETIMKLLAKAEANGTTPAEREALSAKAAELMIKWGIEEAMLTAANADRLKTEAIVKREIATDVPKSFSHEYAVIGCYVADALGTKGLLQSYRSHKTLIVIGFESDVERVVQLYKSLVVQCTQDLGKWYRGAVREWHSGTDRYNIKRGFISGFSTGVGDKLKQIYKQAVADSGTGTDLVLVDRRGRVDSWISANMRTTTSAGRRYDASARGAGFGAGQRANVGQTNVGGGRTALGR